MIVLTMMLLISGGAFQVSPILRAPHDIILIDGRKNPELIPEYVLWEHGFGGLAMIKENDMKPAIDSLHLSPSDFALVWKEAGQQRHREEESMALQRQRRQALAARGLKPAEWVPELRELILEYRWSVLNARDRLLAAMSPEGQVTLLAWIEQRRANITGAVPKSDLEFFRQPR